MPTMKLRFPGGRYHATPGGHHVNEGQIEWPPSPWRIVRALIACGYGTQHWTEIPPIARRLVESLSEELPVYHLPAAALGHSRHYMPIARFKHGREDTTLVLDAFADVGDGELWVRWPAKLDEEAARLLAVLVAHLGYLGRSESWVVGETIPDEVPMPLGGRAFPHVADEPPPRGYEQIAVTAPVPARAYATWRARELEAAAAELGLQSDKKPTKAQQKSLAAAEAPYPVDLVDCLQRDTAWWRAQKWSRAPGSRTVLYCRPGNSLAVGTPTSARVPDERRVEMMLLALTTPSGSKSALPPLVRTLPQAELLHRALVSKIGFEGDPCPELVGRDAMGELLKGHQHTHLLPVDLDNDGRLDHVILFAPMGLGRVAQRAVRAIRKTYTKRGVGELQVAVAGLGALGDLRALDGELGVGLLDVLGAAEGSGSWISATPFVPPRHLKKHGRSSLVGQVEAELQGRGLPPANVEVLAWSADTLALRHFVRRRDRGPQPPRDLGVALRIHFAEPIRGPLCLGYGSHFGLGRFRADFGSRTSESGAEVRSADGITPRG